MNWRTCWICAFSEIIQRRYLDSTRRPRQRRAQRRMHGRELIDEAEQGRPRGRVERREHVEGGASVPRCSTPRMPYQRLASVSIPCWMSLSMH